MALHPDFPASPYAPLIPEQRWFLADEVLRDKGNLFQTNIHMPDFIVRTIDGTVWIVETKGREELDLPQKMARLKLWCTDATAAEDSGRRYDFVFVDQAGFEKHQPGTFGALVASFTDYKS